MKIVMTGGTGLIGGALGQALVKKGHELHVLVRSLETARQNLSFPCALYEWSGEALVPTQAMKDADIVIHLAGENVASQRWSTSRKRALILSRVKTAEGLAKSVQKPLKAFISASAVGIYGDRGAEILSEKSEPGSGFLANLCQRWEQASLEVPADRHLQIRFGVVLSTLGGFLKEVVPMFQTVGASRLGSGEQYVSWIHLQDVVQILVEAVENAKMNGAYNVVAPEPITNSDLTNQLAAVLKCASGPTAPALALKALYGEMSQVLLGSQRAYPVRLLDEHEWAFNFSDFKSAVQDLFRNVQTGEMVSSFEVWVPASPQEVWDFFSSEKNLEKITPPLLNFKVEKMSTPEIQQGSLIDYRLKIHGVPAHWQTRIATWAPPNHFVDEQLKGPYSKWHHLHEFEKLGAGVLLRDTVNWRLPMGRLGRLAALKFVLKDVQKIFSYRSKVIDQIFSPR